MKNRRIIYRYIIGILLIFLSSQPIIVNADYGNIYGVVVSINGPADSGRGLSWYSSEPNLDSNVLVRSKGDTLWEKATLFTGEQTTHNLRIDNSFARKNYYIHKVIVDNLDSGVEYEYKVGSKRHNVWSDVGSFKTDDSTSNKVSFMVATDAHYGVGEKVGNRYYENAIKSANGINPNLDFLVMTGDLISQWNVEFSTFFYKEEEWVEALSSNPYLAQTTFVHSAGNHDNYDKNSDFNNAVFNHYAISPNAELPTTHGVTYSYDYANTHFVVWNNPDVGYVYPKAQLNWLDTDLGGTDKEWKIVFTHVPLYEGQLNYTSEVLTILEKHNVDIVFAGHRHYYMRSKPIKNKVPTQNVTIDESLGVVKKIYTLEDEGIIHTTNSTTGGASSWFNHNEAINDNTASYFGVNTKLEDIGKVEQGNGMYSIVTINDNELTIDVYFRSTSQANKTFKLLESYGNRKDYYKSLNRQIETIPVNKKLNNNDLESLVAIRENLHKYQTHFPALAANIKDENIVKLDSAIDYVSNLPVIEKLRLVLFISLGVTAIVIPFTIFLIVRVLNKKKPTEKKDS